MPGCLWTSWPAASPGWDCSANLYKFAAMNMDERWAAEALGL
jgi:hypothetical protein